MERLAIVSGTLPLADHDLFVKLERRRVAVDSRGIEILVADDFVFLPRHGLTDSVFAPPHLINHLGHFHLLSRTGVTQVIGVYSTGSLRDSLPPGTLVVPDDFICLYPMPTSVSDRPHHITPALDKGLRQDLIRAAEDVELSVRDGGVYWQTAGPRLETKAEIRMMARVADLVGMTMASEAVLAQEFGMAFAAVCSIDNYAHGIGNEIVEDAAIRSQARQSAAGIGRLITLCLERFRIRMRQADKA